MCPFSAVDFPVKAALLMAEIGTQGRPSQLGKQSGDDVAEWAKWALALDQTAVSPQRSPVLRCLYTLGSERTRSDGDRRPASHYYGRAARGAGSARAAGGVA